MTRGFPEKPWFSGSGRGGGHHRGAPHLQLRLQRWPSSPGRSSSPAYSSSSSSSDGPTRAQFAETIQHYATTGVMSQQSRAEIRISFNVLWERGPYSFMVFELGYDSLMWSAFNAGGTTLLSYYRWVLACTGPP